MVRSPLTRHPILGGSRARTLRAEVNTSTRGARAANLRAVCRYVPESTVSRELRRYALDGDDGVYRPGLAHSRARERGRGTRRGIFTRLPELRAEVQAKLDVQWSPEQIAAWLRVAYPSRPEWHVCHETIYQGLYFGGADGFSRNLTKNLRTGRSLRRPRRTSTAREPRFRAPSKSIRQRPVVALERSRVGDFEGDLIVGRYGRSVIGTLVDRTSRFVRLVHVPTGQWEPGWRGGEAFAAALAAAVADLSPQKRLTLTWDQGVEMARHDLVARPSSIPTEVVDLLAVSGASSMCRGGRNRSASIGAFRSWDRIDRERGYPSQQLLQTEPSRRQARQSGQTDREVISSAARCIWESAGSCPTKQSGRSARPHPRARPRRKAPGKLLGVMASFPRPNRRDNSIGQARRTRGPDHAGRRPVCPVDTEHSVVGATPGE